MHIERLPQNPIIFPKMPGMKRKIGKNINGPSLIRVPEWIEKPLGKFYLYFGHHAGQFIRLAYADHIEGPYTVYRPGTLQSAEVFPDIKKHIASPDIYIDEEQQQIWDAKEQQRWDEEEQETMEEYEYY